ncbi:unnamed protein product [Rangifer tarandus platyrhynchus]|uniref:Uncharacterized protein n=1 Tax=Rangifer tarandus platyrhynchus TaxID=3082113 RepID=A0AC59Z8N6_RANTA
MPAVLWGSAEQSSRSPAGFAPDVRGLASLSLPIHISAEDPQVLTNTAPSRLSCPGPHCCASSLGLELQTGTMAFCSSHCRVREAEPPPGPERELRSNTQKRIVQGDAHANKARGFTGEGGRAESSRLRQEEPGALLLPHGALRPCGDGIRFRVISDPSSRLRVLPAASAWLSQDGVQQGAFWEVVGYMALPFDLS